MFGRKKDDQPASPVDERPHREGAKNRPTPKRRDQEAARKRPLVQADRKGAKAADRAHVLNTARAAHPERFSTPDAVPKILALPDAAWINNPANRDDPQTYQPAA